MELKCPFASTITNGRAACSQAREVVRRGGSEYDCQAASRHQRCSTVHAKLKASGLAAFEVDDDLTQMPHSVLVKVQGGGLAGLQRLMGADPSWIADIDRLVEQALAHWGGLNALPTEALTADMLDYKLTRRTRRRS